MSCKVKHIGANHHSQICTYIVTCLRRAYPIIISVHPLFSTMVMLIHYTLMSGCICMHDPMVYKVSNKVGDIYYFGEWHVLFLVKRELPIFKNVNCK